MNGDLPGSSIPDEEWTKFQMESEGPARLAAPKEPSARARLVAERLRRADEEAARQQGRVRRWARRGKAPVRAEPDGWRAWPARQAPKRRSRVRGFLWVVVAIGLLVLMLNPERVFAWLV
ncbi:hypothetical protein [Streptomyces sp. NPDC002889]|uniref:hypothetical protein n=1 Tax=Streptomyces sp. NPDC002889 TaxID=3364669 RepID=UPI0036CE71EA